jgi:PGF-CTERM protein
VPASTTRTLAVGVTTVAVAFLLFGAVGALTDDGVASAAHESGDHPDWVHHENHTVQLTSHQPGEKSGLQVWASIPEGGAYGNGLQEYSVAANYAPPAFTGGMGADEVPCSRENLKVGGVDRGANLSGTGIDESVISNIKNYWIEKTDDGELYIMVETYSQNDMGGEHLELKYTDQVVIVTDECFTNPEQTGWYRIGSYSNGTTYDGEYIEAAGYSHYFHICDCEDREAAIEKLGPPPVEGYGHEGSRVYKKAAELDNGPPETWDLAATREPGDGDGSQGAATETPESNDTPEPTEAPGSDPDSGESDATATPEPEPSGPTATQAPGGDGGGDGGPSGGGGDGDGSSGDGAGDDGGSGDGAGDDGGSGDGGSGGQTTPTASEGPGFGPLVALLALLAASLLAHRRR